MSIGAFRRLEVAERSLALHSPLVGSRSFVPITHCWYVLVSLAGWIDGRAFDVAPLTAGRSTLAIEAIIGEVFEGMEKEEEETEELE